MKNLTLKFKALPHILWAVLLFLALPARADLPIITTEPTNVTAPAGSTVSFTVVAANGVTPYTYKWKLGGVIVPGSAATLTLVNISDSQAGGYTVVVTDHAGSSVTSAPPAVLTVTHPPVITSQPSSQVVNTGDEALFFVDVNGATPFSYQWQSNGIAISGQADNSLDLNPVRDSDALTYSVFITNSDGSVTSGNALLTVVEPVLVGTPSLTAAINTCTNVTLSVLAYGPDPSLVYFWYFGPTLIMSSTNANLTLSNISFASAGDYSVTVSNSAGSVAQASGTLTVTDPPPVVLTRNISVQLDATGNVSITPAQVDNGSYDNCAIASMSVSPSNFTCLEFGANTVTLSVTDNNAQVSTASAIVTVQDLVPPTPAFQAISVQLDNTGNYALSLTDLSNLGTGSSDACGIAGYSANPNTFGICDIGAKSVTLTVTDSHGNIATTNGTITVLAPVAPPAIVYVDPNYTNASCAVVTFPFIGGTGTNYVGYNAFPTIQAGVNAVASGGTVNAAAGNYAEAVTISQKLNLVGTGSGTNPASATIVNGGASPAITLTAGGVAANDRLTLSNLQLTGLDGVFIDSTISYITLSGVAAENCPNYGVELHNSANITDMQLNGCFLDNCNIGFRKSSTAQVNGLSILNGTMNGNVEGIYAALPSSGPSSAFNNITVNGTVFSGDTLKGIYAESLSQALFENLHMTNCGTNGVSAAGININLKFGNYSDIQIINSDITGCGTGDPANGGGVIIEARGTGSDSSYASNPASLTNVTLADLNVTGSLDGIRFGEPGKNNVGPTGVTIYGCNLSANTRDGLNNDTQTSPSAVSNWWGDVSGPSGAANPYGMGSGVSGLVSFSPWLSDGTDTSPDPGFQPNAAPANFPPTQLVFATEPAGADLGSPLSIQPVVQVEDANGNLTPWANPAISNTLGNDLTGAVLTGTNPQTATNGVATFTDLAVTVSGGSNLTLVASAASLASATSTSFDISNLVPAITTLVPAFAVAGDPGFALTVNGTNFGAEYSTVRWNGSARATAYVSPTQLTATITTGDIASTGTPNVTVFNVGPGGGESAPVSFSILPVPATVYVNANYTSGGTDDGHLWGYDAFASVQAGINRVAPTGTVNVAAGAYAESDIVNKPVTLLGANHGMPGCGTRVGESVINAGLGNAITITASNVVVDGFELNGVESVVNTNGYTGIAVVNNTMNAVAVGVDARNIVTTLGANFTLQNNCITLAAQLAGSTPTVGVGLNGVTGTQAPLIQSNSIQRAYYGYLLYSLNAAAPTVVQGGSVTGAMQGVSILNVNPLNPVTLSSSTFGVDGVSVSGFSGSYPSLASAGIDFQAGVYVFTTGPLTAAQLTGTITNVTVTGSGNISSDSGGLYLIDFSTVHGVRQQVAVQNCTVSSNANRGIFVSGSNAVATVNGSSVLGNGSNPFGTGGNPGFGILARNNASVTVSNCFIANPATVTSPYTVSAIAADADTGPLGPTMVVSDCSIVNNGNPSGLLASQDAGTLNASGNWWGTASDTAIAGLMTGVVDYTPYLDNGSDTDPVTPGFQGDYSALHVTQLGAQIGGTGRIQEGINSIADGSLTGGNRQLDVKAGIYTEINSPAFTGILVDRPLTMSSSSGAASTIISNTMLYMIEIDAPNVTMNGFTVTDPTLNTGGFGGDGTGIYIDPYPPSDLSNVHVENCVVHDLGERYVGIYSGSGPNLEIDHCSVYNITGYPSSENNPTYFSDNPDQYWSDEALGVLVADFGAANASVSIHDNNIHDILPLPYSLAIEIGNNVSSASVSNNLVTLSASCYAGVLVDNFVTGPASVVNNTISGSTNALMLNSPFAQTATGNSISGAATSIYVLSSSATLKNNSASVGSGVGVWVSGASAKALIEANTLVGDSEAAIKVDGGAIVDAGDCTGGNATELGTGSGMNGSSAGGNNMSSYGFDNHAPWAIENLNAGTPAVLAYQNSYGAVVGNNLPSLFTGNVLADQSGGLLVQYPGPLTFQCLSSVPAGATNFAGFVAQSGAVSATVVNVSFSDAVVSNTPNNRVITRTYTLSDACSQIASNTQTITVQDTIPPVVTTWPTNRTLDVGGQCNVAVPNLTNEIVAGDNCETLVFAQSPAAGTLLSLGTTNVLVTVTDGGGNTVSTNVILAVVDSNPAPLATYVDKNYLALAAGTPVSFPFGGTNLNHFVGCDAFATIQAGINRVATNGAVKVAAGTYAEVVLVDHSLALLGAQAGQNSTTRFAAFTTGVNGPKADSAIETIITAAATAPANGVNDSVHIKADNVTIDGFVVDGNNPGLSQGGATLVGAVNTDSRRAIESEDANGNLFAVSGALIRNNIVQNYAQRGVELANPSDTSPATSGSAICGNVIANFGADGILLANNAYSDVKSNLVLMAANTEAGIWLLDFPSSGATSKTMDWSYNTVTVSQDPFAGIWVNLFYASAATLNIHDNVLNAASGVTGTNDLTYGIYLTSLQNGTTANLSNNIIGASGGQFARGIALWNLPTTTTTTVTGGSISNSIIGVSAGYNDENFGPAGASFAANLSGVAISGAQVGAYIESADSDTNTVQMQISGNTGIHNCAVGIGLLASNALANIHDNLASITGNSEGVEVDGGKARLQNNDLTGNTVAGIFAFDGAIVDAGNCTGADVTGLGISTGGNLLTGYNFGGTGPWAIVNENTNGLGSNAPIILADHDNFGAVVGDNIPGALFGAVEYAQTPAVIAAPTNLSLVCASSVPAGATNLADFVTQGGYYAASAASVAFVDDTNFLGSGVIHRTYTVTDGCSVPSTAVQTITVSDTIPPTFSLVTTNVTYPADLGQCSKSNVTWVIVPMDNCAVASLVSVPTNGSTFGHGTTTVTTVATDYSGNTATNTFTVTVIDTQAPVVTQWPTNQTLDVNGQCLVAVPDLTLQILATDNCDTPVYSQSPVAGTLVSLGMTNVLVTVSDSSSNSVSTNVILNVVDSNPAPLATYVDTNYAALAAGTPVSFPFGGTNLVHYVGCDAFSTIQAGVNRVVVSGTVNVAAGRYSELVTISNSLSLIGPNAGVNPNSDTRNDEAVIAEPGSDTNNDNVVTVTGSVNVVVSGFTVDGDNLLVSGPINGAEGILIAASSSVAVSNNIVKNFAIAGLDANGENGASTNITIFQNRVLNVPGQTNVGYGYGILFEQNAYGSAKANFAQGTRRGIMVDGNLSGPSNTVSIAENQIDATQVGIWINNSFQSTAGTVSVTSNTITSTASSTVLATNPNYSGIFFASLWSNPGSVIASNNTITGQFNYGIHAWNNAMNVTVSGGSIDGSSMQVGVLEEAVDSAYGPVYTGGQGLLTLQGVAISNAPVAVWIDDNGSGGSYPFVKASVQASTIVGSALATGIEVTGPLAKAIVNNSSINGNALGVSVDTGVALLQGNDLTGNSVAALSVLNGAIVDAGDCTGGNVTGLGAGSGLNGSSAGNNILTGYTYDNSAPWAITNANTTAQSAVLAYNNDFGTSNNINALIFDGTDTSGANSQVIFSEEGVVLITTPGATNVQCTGDIPVAATNLAQFIAIGGSVSSPSVTVASSDTVLSPGPHEGTITRTYTLTDTCGNIGICQQTITVEDTIPPSVATHSDITQTNDAGQCNAVVTFTLPIATDNCGVASLVATPASGSTFPVGTTLVTVVATDFHGNTNASTFNVIVSDTEVPVIAAMSNIVQTNDHGHCSAVVSFSLPFVSDNCGVASVVATPASGSTFLVGVTTVSVVATDIHNNSSTNSFTVTVNDTEPPVIAATTNIVQVNDPNQTSAVVNFILPNVTDNCDVASVIATPPSGSTFPAGTTTVNILATDIHSNTATASFTVTINDLPVITSQPVSITNNAQTTATFAVTVTGTTPFSYQWYKNLTNALIDGGNITGATSNILTLSNVLAADAAQYSVIITNVAGSTTSSNATLVVIDPVINSQPTNVTTIDGTTIAFNITVAGTAPLNYQWQFDGFPLSDGNGITGTTTSNLTITGVADTDAGNYAVIVTNTAGSVTSSVVSLTILHPPVIVSPPVSETVNLGSPAGFAVSVNGRTPFTYQWLFNGTNISGATNRVLSINPALDANAGNYMVMIANADGSTNSGVVTLTVIDPPIITNQPVSLTNNAGTTATFTVGASGTSPSYQWFKGVGAITGATTATLTLTNVSDSDAAGYHVTLTNAAGTATSTTATLTVIDAPMITTEPASRTNNAGTTATFTVVATGTSPSYQWFKGAGIIPGATAATLTLANVSDGDAAGYHVTLTNAAGNATSTTATLTVIDGPVITGQPISITNNAGDTVTFSVTNTGTAPFSYQWIQNATNILVDGGNISGSTNTTLTITNVLGANGGVYTVSISNPAGTVTSSPATLTVIDPIITNQPVGLVTNESDAVTFTVGAYGTLPLNYQWALGGVPVDGATNSSLTVSALESTVGNYTVIVTNVYGSVTSSVATLTIIDPAILTQPTNVTAFDGSTVSFSVTVTGTPTISYQWQVDGVPLTDGFGISGSMTSTLTISNVTDSDDGNYSVIVTNAYGHVTSSNAVLITFPPLITTQPVGVTVNVGQPANFSVSANGATPFSYQWQFNGAPINGATNRLFGFAHVADTNAGSYTVIVTNPDGSQTSSPAALIVNDPPVITSSPTNENRVVGMTATFTVGATGPAILGYQWLFNGTNLTDGGGISGSTNATLSIANVTTAQGGGYNVIVSNTGALFIGSATSSVATLTIYPTAAPILSSPIYTRSNGQFTVTLTGVPTFNYSLQSSTNLLDWTSITTNVSPFTFTDTNTQPHHFYRGHYLP